ncbi:hypothetical protein WJX74_002567 [Apatococcus lobatus]|uniref:Uncharacterized protein n=1 Tax=Apatococcus lobatus TaxID=904363 RepID=A0AAW1RDC5_9CHLO
MQLGPVSVFRVGQGCGPIQRDIRARPLARRQLLSAATRRASDELKIIREAREKQLSVTDLLAKLTNATQKPSMADIAAQNANSLTEEFFLTTSTYMEMAKKEGNTEIAGKLEEALRTAMAEKQKHLRPEIRLLNQLMQIQDDSQRLKLLQASKNTVQMNDGYFLKLVDNMMKDLKRQPKSSGSALAIHQLQSIQQGAPS